MKVFITGITGQDGYYLSKELLEEGHEVHGTIRRSSSFNTSRIDSLISAYGETGQLKLYYSDLLDSSSLNNLINTIEPDQIYNLAAQSHVAVSFKNPLFTDKPFSCMSNTFFLSPIPNSIFGCISVPLPFVFIFTLFKLFELLFISYFNDHDIDNIR